MELLRHPGELVTRDQLRERLWAPGTFVDFDEGVNTAVKKLRGYLGDSPENPIYIETVSRHGYRLIVPVVQPASEDRLEERGLSAPGRTGRAIAEATKTESSRSSRNRLRFLVTGAAVILLSAGAIVAKWWKPVHRAEDAIQAIAVLPLENFSGDAAQDYFADGMTDEIITNLAKLGGTRVISRTSSLQYKGTRKTVPEIARELNVGAVVEGSVERVGNRVRVRVQLIHGTSDQHLWAEEYDREIKDVLGLEAALAGDIAEHIQLHLSESRRQSLTRTRIINPEAFQDYLLGRHYWATRTQDGLQQAIRHFNRAIEEDPSDARSYAGLAQAYIVLPMLTPTSQAEASQKAREAALKALALDNSLAEAHLAVAEVLFYQDWDFAGAENEFKKTLEENRNYSTGHQWYGEFLSIMGRHKEAIREEQEALALDPLSAIIHLQAASTLRDAGHFEEAIAQYGEVLRISPGFVSAYEAMSWVYRRQGKYAEAIQAMEAISHIPERDPQNIQAIDALSSAYKKGGKAGYFRQCLEVHKFNARPNFYFARDHVELGDRQAALAELEQSYRNHDLEILWLLTDPEMDPLRSDPRFQKLMREVGFSQ